MVPILISLILGYLIYIYVFRKQPGEKLEDVKKEQFAIQQALVQRPPPPSALGTPFEAALATLKLSQTEQEQEDQEEVEQEDISEDNITRESLYEEILNLKILKNPVDFSFTPLQMNRKAYCQIVEVNDDQTIDGLDASVDDSGKIDTNDKIEETDKTDKTDKTDESLSLNLLANVDVNNIDDLDLSTEESYPKPSEEFGHIEEKITHDMKKLDSMNEDSGTKRKITIKKKNH
jgi:hypothetical protein